MHAPRRKLTLLDAMILIAAVAIGIEGALEYFLHARGPETLVQWRARATQIAWSRAIVASSVQAGQADPLAFARSNQRMAAIERRIDAEKAASSLNVFLSIWTLALLALGLRKPRPRLRRLAHEPGWSGCLVVIVVLVLRTLSALALWGAELTQTSRWPWVALVALFDDLAAYAGPAVVAVWVVFALGGRCRRDRSALGWLSLITAASWVILIFQQAAIVLLAPV